MASDESLASSVIGDRSTSDVIVRLRTHEGRDDWLYCHTHILVEKTKYFADRLSENWPTCQILDSRNCVEVYCQESDFDHHVNFLRLLYVIIDGSVDDLWHSVKNALGVLRIAVELQCPQIVTACVNYIEAVPWEESDEEVILRIIPKLGSQAQPILARLQPVDPTATMGVFLSALRFATSSPPPPMKDLKASAQDQVEYMITEDDDAPLIAADDEIKSEVSECINQLFARFEDLLESLSCGPMVLTPESSEIQLLQSHISDLTWGCQMLTKLEIMKVLVDKWVKVSEKIVSVVDLANPTTEIILTKLKVIEVTSKVLEAIGYGSVILSTCKRLHILNVWLPFVRVTKPMIDCLTNSSDEDLVCKMDGELWQSLESSIVSIVLALPSVDQAGILTEWLGNKNVQYPDLTEAFEVWCYRSKVSKRRLASLHDDGLADKTDIL